MIISHMTIYYMYPYVFRVYHNAIRVEKLNKFEKSFKIQEKNTTHHKRDNLLHVPIRYQSKLRNTCRKIN